MTLVDVWTIEYLTGKVDVFATQQSRDAAYASHPSETGFVKQRSLVSTDGGRTGYLVQEFQPNHPITVQG